MDTLDRISLYRAPSMQSPCTKQIRDLVERMRWRFVVDHALPSHPALLMYTICPFTYPSFFFLKITRAEKRVFCVMNIYHMTITSQ